MCIVILCEKFSLRMYFVSTCLGLFTVHSSIASRCLSLVIARHFLRQYFVSCLFWDIFSGNMTYVKSFLGHLLRHNLDSIFIIVVMQISTLSLNAAMLLYDVLLLARQVSDTTIRLIESPILKIFLIITKLFVWIIQWIFVRIIITKSFVLFGNSDPVKNSKRGQPYRLSLPDNFNFQLVLKV